MKELSRAREYVARMRPYILGRYPKEERVRIETELDGDLLSNGSADVIAQQAVLRRESERLWTWMQGVQVLLDAQQKREPA